MLGSLRTRGGEEGKNTGTLNPGVEAVASESYFPITIGFMPGYLGAFTLKNSGSEISTPDFLSPLSPFI